MTSETIHRRAILAAALASPGFAFAQPPAPTSSPTPDQLRNQTFATGPLAKNPVARRFRKLPETMAWPPSPLLDSGGPRPISAFKGKVILLSLWSENCGPCLIELPIFAKLNAKYGGPNFEIVPVVTGPSRFTSTARAQRFLNEKNIGLRPLLDGGEKRDELMNTVAASRRDPRGALPCNILIDKEGRLRGRQTGFVITVPAGAPRPQTQADIEKYGVSLWQTPEADEFFEGLVGGALG